MGPLRLPTRPAQRLPRLVGLQKAIEVGHRAGDAW